jgi:DNA-binding MarR family transcriptional regulator
MGDSIASERGLPLALRAAYMALHRSTEAAFADHGVTADQFVLMLALQEGRSLTQRELAERIWSDASTVRAMLVLLDKNGYVKRAPHPEDSRAKTVELTAEGKRKLKKLWRVGQMIRDQMYSSLSAKESQRLIESLRTVARSLERDRNEPT